MSGRLSTAGRAAVAALLVAGVTPGAAVASGAGAAGAERASAACYVSVGSVTPGGGQTGKFVTAGAPTQADHLYPDVFPAGAVRVAGSTSFEVDVPGYDGAVSGQAVMGSSMYDVNYRITLENEVDRTSPIYVKVGGGWADTTFFETTRYWGSPGLQNPTTQYALRSTGTLTRWEMAVDRGTQTVIWTDKQSATGFSSVKTMAMISQTLTYDTFLANTRGGALYTIRLPRTSPMKPIVKLVRGSTWQAFESLVASKCGQYGTMLVAIDKDTHSAYAYAIGHANGTATVIQGLGKVPATFADQVYYRRQIRPSDQPMLFGE